MENFIFCAVLMVILMLILILKSIMWSYILGKVPNS